MSYRPLKYRLLFYVQPLSHPLPVCLWLFVQFIQYSLLTICWEKAALLAFCFCCLFFGGFFVVCFFFFVVFFIYIYIYIYIYYVVYIVCTLKFCHYKDILTLIGPLHNLSSTNYRKSGLSQEISHTSKHNYSKESTELKTENINCIKSSVFRYKEDIVTPLEPNTCKATLPTPILVWVREPFKLIIS